MKWTGEGKEFVSPPTGTHLARCIKIIDIGTQTGEYKSEPTVARKNVIYWELPYEKMDDGKPFIVSKFYTASLGEKANLRKDLVAWRSKEFTPEELRGFDSKNILDKACQVTIIQKENGKTSVAGISGVPKGVEIPDRYNDLFYFMLDDFTQEGWDKLSDGMKKLVKQSAEFDSLGVIEEGEQKAPEYTGEKGGFGDHVQVSAVDDSEIPF